MQARKVVTNMSKARMRNVETLLGHLASMGVRDPEALERVIPPGISLGEAVQSLSQLAIATRQAANGLPTHLCEVCKHPNARHSAKRYWHCGVRGCTCEHYEGATS